MISLVIETVLVISLFVVLVSRARAAGESSTEAEDIDDFLATVYKERTHHYSCEGPEHALLFHNATAFREALAHIGVTADVFRSLLAVGAGATSAVTSGSEDAEIEKHSSHSSSDGGGAQQSLLQTCLHGLPLFGRSLWGWDHTKDAPPPILAPFVVGEVPPASGGPFCLYGCAELVVTLTTQVEKSVFDVLSNDEVTMRAAEAQGLGAFLLDRDARTHYRSVVAQVFGLHNEFDFTWETRMDLSSSPSSSSLGSSALGSGGGPVRDLKWHNKIGEYFHQEVFVLSTQAPRLWSELYTEVEARVAEIYGTDGEVFDHAGEQGMNRCGSLFTNADHCRCSAAFMGGEKILCRGTAAQHSVFLADVWTSDYARIGDAAASSCAAPSISPLTSAALWEKQQNPLLLDTRFSVNPQLLSGCREWDADALLYVLQDCHPLDESGCWEHPRREFGDHDPESGGRKIFRLFPGLASLWRDVWANNSKCKPRLKQGGRRMMEEFLKFGVIGGIPLMEQSGKGYPRMGFTERAFRRRFEILGRASSVVDGAKVGRSSGDSPGEDDHPPYGKHEETWCVSGSEEPADSLRSPQLTSLVEDNENTPSFRPSPPPFSTPRIIGGDVLTIIPRVGEDTSTDVDLFRLVALGLHTPFLLSVAKTFSLVAEFYFDARVEWRFEGNNYLCEALEGESTLTNYGELDPTSSSTSSASPAATSSISYPGTGGEQDKEGDSASMTPPLRSLLASYDRELHHDRKQEEQQLSSSGTTPLLFNAACSRSSRLSPFQTLLHWWSRNYQDVNIVFPDLVAEVRHLLDPRSLSLTDGVACVDALLACVLLVLALGEQEPMGMIEMEEPGGGGAGVGSSSSTRVEEGDEDPQEKSPWRSSTPLPLFLTFSIGLLEFAPDKRWGQGLMRWTRYFAMRENTVLAAVHEYLNPIFRWQTGVNFVFMPSLALAVFEKNENKSASSRYDPSSEDESGILGAATGSTTGARSLHHPLEALFPASRPVYRPSSEKESSSRGTVLVLRAPFFARKEGRFFRALCLRLRPRVGFRWMNDFGNDDGGGAAADDPSSTVLSRQRATGVNKEFQRTRVFSHKFSPLLQDVDAALYLPSEPSLLKFRDFYATATPLLVPAWHYMNKLMILNAGQIQNGRGAGRWFSVSTNSQTETDDSEQDRRSDRGSLDPRLTLPEAFDHPFFKVGAESHAILFFWNRLSDPERVPHLLRFRSVSDLVRIVASKEKLREISERMRRWQFRRLVPNVLALARNVFVGMAAGRGGSGGGPGAVFPSEEQESVGEEIPSEGEEGIQNPQGDGLPNEGEDGIVHLPATGKQFALFVGRGKMNRTQAAGAGGSLLNTTSIKVGDRTTREGRGIRNEALASAVQAVRTACSGDVLTSAVDHDDVAGTEPNRVLSLSAATFVESDWGRCALLTARSILQ